MIFKATPPAYSSVNSNLVYVVYDAHSTDPTTYPNYKYVAELWIGGSLILTTRKFPDPTNNFGVFDFGINVREYLLVSLAIGNNGIRPQEMGPGVFSIDVVIKIREEYNGTIGAVVLTDSDRVFFNHYNGRYNDFTLLSSFLNKPASTRPQTIDDMRLDNAYYFIPYFSTTTTPFNVVVVCGTNTYTKSITPSTTNTLQLLNISPLAINNDAGSAIVNGDYTVNINGIAYVVSIQYDVINQNYPLHFLNKFGGFETFNFLKASKRSYSNTKKEWQMLPYQVDSSGSVTLKTGNIMNRQNGTLAVDFNEKLKVNTDNLTDSEFEWLAQLVNSPLVYLEDAGTLYPVILDGNSYDVNKHSIDNLTSLSIDIKFGETYKTQFTS